MRFEWTRLSRELLLRTPVYHVFKEPHSHPDIAAPIDFCLLESRDWANVIAVDTDSIRDSRARMLWVKQYRVGTESVTWEIPGGSCDEGDADPLHAAQRELTEETGATARRWLHLGSMSPNAATHRNQVHTYLALGCSVADDVLPLGDSREVLERQWLPFSQRYDRVLDGKVNHALVVAAFGLLEAHLSKGHAL